jgi:transcriptional regulator with XRE-family HTH domain
MKLAERIKKARKHAELTQAELIQRIKDIYGEKNAPTQQTLSKLETGNQDGTEFAVKIAKACGVSPYWIDAEIGEMTGESGSALKSRDSKSPSRTFNDRPSMWTDSRNI